MGYKALTGEEPANTAIPILLEAHGGLIYNLGMRLCGGPDEAEDLVQETFMRAFKKWDQFEGRADPATWLYSIAARTCQRLKRLRSGEPRHMASFSELLPSGEARVPDLPYDKGPFDDVLRHEATALIEQALTTLPIHFRLPLVLKEIAEFSIEEVANILGLKEATVKTRVHRGRLLLRKTLARNLPQRNAPPPDHSRQTCLDLLHAKQEAMDRGVPFSFSRDALCSRCQALFATLDLAHDACVDIRQGQLPEKLRQAMLKEFGGN